MEPNRIRCSCVCFGIVWNWLLQCVIGKGEMWPMGSTRHRVWTTAPERGVGALLKPSSSRREGIWRTLHHLPRMVGLWFYWQKSDNLVSSRLYSSDRIIWMMWFSGLKMIGYKGQSRGTSRQASACSVSTVGACPSPSGSTSDPALANGLERQQRRTKFLDFCIRMGDLEGLLCPGFRLIQLWPLTPFEE